jgi:hypothetical protein
MLYGQERDDAKFVVAERSNMNFHRRDVDVVRGRASWALSRGPSEQRDTSECQTFQPFDVTDGACLARLNMYF